VRLEKYAGYFHTVYLLARLGIPIQAYKFIF